MSEPLIDCHAHFLHAQCGRSDWREVNAARFRAGDKIGVTCHVASILGTYGFTSPTYFPSPADVTLGNDAMLALCKRRRTARRDDGDRESESHAARARRNRALRDGGRGWREAAREPAGRRSAARSDLRARGDSTGLPVLHHIWQHRRREWPNQEISDGADLARLAARHPKVIFILAHIGGGGDYAHTFHAVKDSPNIYPDLSGSGVDRGMLDDAIKALGARACSGEATSRCAPGSPSCARSRRPDC